MEKILEAMPSEIGKRVASIQSALEMSDVGQALMLLGVIKKSLINCDKYCTDVPANLYVEH